MSAGQAATYSALIKQIDRTIPGGHFRSEKLRVAVERAATEAPKTRQDGKRAFRKAKFAKKR